MKIIDGTIASPLGFSADGLHAGFKKKKLDFGWIVSEVPASVAGVYTTNKVIAAPLLVTKASIQKSQKLQAIVVNSGIANSCTGQQGLDAAYEMQRLTAQKLEIEPDLVGLASTGVIGEQLPMDALKNGLSQILVSGKAEDFAEAILTTDTCTKTCVVTEEFGSDLVTMAGVAKGSGMIHPNMATMLSFIATDAKVSQPILQLMTQEIADESFNTITVDGDTSTNDSFVIMATGRCGQSEIDNTADPRYAQLKALLGSLALELAQAIVRDGEGATKFITVEVQNAKTREEARKVAYAVAHSPLVKTAFFASDPNLGRLLAAVGYAGIEDLDVDALKMWLDDVLVAENGGRAESYTEEAGQAVMNRPEITVRIDLQRGDTTAVVYTCDLSHEYVSINADYRS